MERRRLGRTGHASSVLIYGGAALADVSQEVADRSIGLALEAGINHLDTAADYGDSEVRLGAWIPRIRDEVFLATKTGDRTASGAYDSIARSLDRLRTGHVDLIQLHAVGDVEDLDRATRTGGAIEGAVRARDEGLVRWIGITGHGMQAPAVHLEALGRFPFDTVMTPFNHRLYREAGYRRDFEALVDRARAEDVGLMAIKTLARNLWREGERPRRTTWYEPVEDHEAIDAAVAFGLAQDGVTGLCTAGDVELVPRMIDAERRALSVEDAEAILSRVPDYEPPFVRVPGRAIPDWLAPLVP